MVIHFHIEPGQGYFRNGIIVGRGQCCSEDMKTGETHFLEGYFEKGKLNTADGCDCDITDTGFTFYDGSFTEGKLDGNVTIITWEDLGSDPDIPEGTGVNNAHGKKHINNSNLAAVLSATKREVVYDMGVEISELSNGPQNVTIQVEVKVHENLNFFSKFSLVKV